MGWTCAFFFDILTPEDDGLLLQIRIQLPGDTASYSRKLESMFVCVCVCVCFPDFKLSAFGSEMWFLLQYFSPFLLSFRWSMIQIIIGPLALMTGLYGFPQFLQVNFRKLPWSWCNCFLLHSLQFVVHTACCPLMLHGEGSYENSWNQESVLSHLQCHCTAVPLCISLLYSWTVNGILNKNIVLKYQGYLAGCDVQYSLQVLICVCHENFSFKGYVWPKAISYQRTMDFGIPGSLG